MDTVSMLTTGSGFPNIVASVADAFSKEGFTSKNDKKSSAGGLMVMINLAIFFGALYYAFKCGNPFDFLAACCCSICYLAYRMAVGCGNA